MTKRRASSSKAETTYTPKARCYESHPPYEIAPGLMIYGGSCWYPIVKDADIYGGFDSGMKLGGSYPWSKADGPIEFLFKITDMQPPEDPAEFAKMIGWLAAQLKAGKKIHLGCIGGHGRTGTVFAALRKHLTGDENATQHVRDNYCQKAVESKAQVEWLKQHYGINPVEPTKSYGYGTQTGRSNSSGTTKSSGSNRSVGFEKVDFGPNLLDYGRPKDTTTRHADDYSKLASTSTGQPLYSKASVWG